MTISDIVNKTYFLTKTNSTSFPAATMLYLINNAYDRVTSLILQCDGRWQWDDTNNTTFPIGTTTLVASQQDYTMDVSHLRILGVSVKDVNGNFYKLEPIDPDDMGDTDRSEFLETAGKPQYYDKLGSSVILYPAPDAGISVTLSAGLKVYYQRGPSVFTSAEVTAGTKVPGFNSLYHDLIPLWTSYDYAIANGLKNANQIMAEIQRKEDALIKDYAKRDKDERNIMTMKKIDFV